MRRTIVAIVVGLGIAFGCWILGLDGVGELIYETVRNAVPNQCGRLPRYIALGVTLSTLTLPGIVATALIARGGKRLDDETRCRNCGYILRGITEPRCPECGVSI